MDMTDMKQPGAVSYMDPTDIDNAVALVPQTTEQAHLKNLIMRRHPDYKDDARHWEFLEETYEGGREWFKKHIFRYLKEGEQEFQDRKERAYRFNHTREVVDLINKYLFKQNILRNHKDAPDSVNTFWKSATKTGLSMRDFSRQISKKTSIYGRIGIVVDNNGLDGQVISKADEKNSGIKTYAYIVSPIQLLDYAYDDSEGGPLSWVLIQETYREDADPIKSSGEVKFRYRLWTKIDWQLYEVKREGRKQVIVMVAQGKHNLGVVPVILADHIITDELYKSPAMIDDIAYLDRASANYLSNLDAIIQDQTFSQLAMPAQNVLPGEDAYTKLVELGTKRTFLYDGESGHPPFYLSPDPKQAQLILAVVNKIIGEIYHTVGLAGERTKQDNAVGIENASGIAKAFDFERVNALLAAKADSLEVIENKIAALVALWNGEEDQMKDDLVHYPDNFDTRGLYDEFDIAARLMLIEAPDTLRQEQMKAMMEKLFPQLSKDLKAKMLADIADWPQLPLQIQAQLKTLNFGSVGEKTVATAGAPNVTKANTPTPAGGAGKKPQADKKQGQVTQ
ncbi:hypothetical protein [Ferrovum sp.]|uniref:hypothetical protein n=1 Tax=Ferrovum sp. TaxID=2609467 RepID=UPI0026312AB2|nr:hypothetical protein [Ferrovum sp.]